MGVDESPVSSQSTQVLASHRLGKSDNPPSSSSDNHRIRFKEDGDSQAEKPQKVGTGYGLLSELNSVIDEKLSADTLGDCCQVHFLTYISIPIKLSYDQICPEHFVAGVALLDISEKEKKSVVATFLQVTETPPTVKALYNAVRSKLPCCLVCPEQVFFVMCYEADTTHMLQFLRPKDMGDVVFLETGSNFRPMFTTFQHPQKSRVEKVTSLRSVCFRY
jgi:hypothetical protein